jgi:hypothetical protein
MTFVVGALGALVVCAEGCGGGGGSSCTAGQETCPCTPSGLCDTGLTCASDRCVNLNDVSGTAGTNGGAGAGGDPTAACSPLTAYCQKLSDCAPSLLKIVYGTIAQCHARFVLSCADAVTAPDTGLTTATIAACATALPGATCQDAIYRNVAACEAKGNRANGVACGTSWQCQSGYCAQGDQACGVCGALGNPGAVCTVDDNCAPGLLCGGGTCVAPGILGGVCSDTQPCAYGLFCGGGVCASAAETPGGDCVAGLPESCDLLAGLDCDDGSSKCASLGFAQSGEPCGLVGSTYVFCVEGQCAYATAAATEGLCGAFAGDGAACDDTTPCEAPARCLSGRCALPSSAQCQ